MFEPANHFVEFAAHIFANLAAHFPHHLAKGTRVVFESAERRGIGHTFKVGSIASGNSYFLDLALNPL